VSEVWEAADRVQGGGIRATALLPSPWLAQRCRAARMLFKLENQQATGSFKARGAVNKARKLLADLHADVPGASAQLACSSQRSTAIPVVPWASSNVAVAIRAGCSTL